MKAKIPSDLKINIDTYNLIFKPNLAIDLGFDGDCHRRLRQIQIDPSQHDSEKYKTLIHEWLEAGKHVYKYDIDHADYDRIANCIAELFYNNLGVEFDWSGIESGDNG